MPMDPAASACARRVGAAGVAARAGEGEGVAGARGARIELPASDEVEIDVDGLGRVEDLQQVRMSA